MLTKEQVAGFVGIGNYGGSWLALWNDDGGNTWAVQVFPSPFVEDY